MKRTFIIFIAAIFIHPGETAAQTPKARLLIALSSYRERRLHPRVHFYEHDGIGSGKVVGAVDTINQRSDYHPSFALDGRLCVFASERENQVGKIQLWDVPQKKEVELPKVNDSPLAQLHPSLSGDGKLLAFAAWNRPGASPRWDVMLYEPATGKFLETPGLNTPTFDERSPALNGDGSLLAYVSNDRAGAGLSDLFLYDRKAGKVLRQPEANSPHSELDPSLSADGRYLAFVSDRPGGAGGRDVYLFDRQTGKFVPLPWLNSAAQEQSPSLSPVGRYLVFVSERISGEGERDVFLYDVQAKKLLPTPGLSSAKVDFDPAVTVLKE
jgi:Tol biopolymer transport system component